MKTVEIYDPALCCSSGVCGPSPDAKLVAFSNVVERLKKAGVSVTRFNLAQEPLKFAQNAMVKRELEEKGEAALPLVFAQGEIAFQGTYPSLEELGERLGVELSPAAQCCEGESCCQDEPIEAKKAPVQFVKVDGPKLNRSNECCDPSTGCC
ncbi:arsenite efflux transporter metallochaperone ArsD [Pelagicoccus sp. SDUM812003]|uniref:arsenite efflux transporter metallochaperone ArsD n=1 Tax=Pelagicoccus sp. SDUM812003 TaxID=3041267 RepID=UPI00280E84E6|nr:arsenite efflux transporter metallochaperone ArsD [Pelagicoccus sp. SDUM812003]MDQ8204123.1 arsenite efflux transporter metallochaperone ArsD [Pelagicoccus sp. SDUM812003]